MTGTVRKLRTYRALGLRSVARVAAYRLGLKLGVHPVLRIAADSPSGPFFRGLPRSGALPEPDRRWEEHVVRFDWHLEPLPPSGIPDWLANPFAPDTRSNVEVPWWTIPDFGGGDIKGLWEASRFGWALAHAGCAAHGLPGAADRLNAWIADWLHHNPPYYGPNWKCGQEASIRMMHLAAAAIMLEEDAAPLPGLLALVALHCARIAPTMGYALGQDNNHGTSEAAALFIGGSWLAAAGDSRGADWAATGRSWLEERAAVLIMPDGSFSQYSVNYHRVMLDTYALAEIWRVRRNLPRFSERLVQRLTAASRWLASMTDAETGDAPNIGASDGARLLPVADTGYRDFRPSVQLAAALFCGVRQYPLGAADGVARWLGVALPDAVAPSPASRTFDDGGWHVLRNERATAVMRYPRFRFRPSQADALHVDLSVDGINMLRDAGTHSYNDPAVPDGDYGATRFHNSIVFDDADQMPKLSRFLFGDWLTADDVSPVEVEAGGQSAAAAYRDHRGNRHHRRLMLRDSGMTCVDTISGPFASAVLRWRLPPGNWSLHGNMIRGTGFSLAVGVEGAKAEWHLRPAREARNYLQSSAVMALEVAVAGPCTITSTGTF